MVGKKISDCGRWTHFLPLIFCHSGFWICIPQHHLVSPCSRESRILSIVTWQEPIRRAGRKMVGKKISDCGRGTHFLPSFFCHSGFWICAPEHHLESSRSRESRILSIVTGQESIRRVGRKMVGKKISDCGRGAHFCAPHFFAILDSGSAHRNMILYRRAAVSRGFCR